MKRLFRISILISLFLGSAFSVDAQRKAEQTSGGRAAYGNTAPDFKEHKKKNKKSKTKALKAAKRKRATNKRSSYFSGRPY